MAAPVDDLHMRIPVCRASEVAEHLARMSAAKPTTSWLLSADQARWTPAADQEAAACSGGPPWVHGVSAGSGKAAPGR